MANLFRWYDPYASVMGTGTPQFRGMDGALLPRRCQSDALLGLAVGVSKIVQHPGSRAEWDAVCEAYGFHVSFFYREELELATRLAALEGKLWFISHSGEPDLTKKLSALPNSSVLLASYEFIGLDQETPLKMMERVYELVAWPMCIACLEEVDNAVGALHAGVDVDAGIHASVVAAQLFANASAIAEGRAIPKSTHARRGARAKLWLDPRQLAKAEVRECWERWQRQPERYNGKAAFARDMLQKFESLKSQPVIEGWCREWERSPPA